MHSDDTAPKKLLVITAYDDGQVYLEGDAETLAPEKVPHMLAYLLHEFEHANITVMERSEEEGE